MKRIKKRITPKEQSIIRKVKNVQKHLNIAKATHGHESNVHVEKAGKLIKKYGFK